MDEGTTAPIQGDMLRETMFSEYKKPHYGGFENCLITTSVCGTWACTPCCAPCCNVTIVKDYERAINFRMGRRNHNGALEGGMYVVYPGIDDFRKVDIRENSINIPAQSVITAEGLSIYVDGVVYYHVANAEKAVLGIKDFTSATRMLAQTKLREVLGMKRFDEIQAQREEIVETLQQLLDEATDPWGIKVNRVEITGKLRKVNLIYTERVLKDVHCVVVVEGIKTPCFVILFVYIYVLLQIYNFLIKLKEQWALKLKLNVMLKLK